MHSLRHQKTPLLGIKVWTVQRILILYHRKGRLWSDQQLQKSCRPRTCAARWEDERLSNNVRSCSAICRANRYHTDSGRPRPESLISTSASGYGSKKVCSMRYVFSNRTTQARKMLTTALRGIFP